MQNLTNVIWLVPLAPLTGFLVLALGGRRLGEPRAGKLALTMSAFSFAGVVAAMIGLLSLDGGEGGERLVIHSLFSWIPVGDLSVDIAFLVDPLSITMGLFVTGVGSLIHLYAVSYMHGEKDYSKFFAYLNLFIFSMSVLILADNLLLTFLGWEGVGVCSYFLISFWFDEEANAVAGKKAFITNRVGDFGFMLAIFFAFFAFGSLSWGEMFSGEVSAVTATAILACLMLGAAGKSAQIPLQVWLPDAMAGPTPVSALIHAATMVTAGVYLLVRVSPIIALSWGWTVDVILWVGLATAIFGALAAVAQTDIKRVLAYSTISQLGFMFAAIGSGAYVAAVFHMITHAFFKALLFLGAGSVVHAMGGEQDIRKHGGLLRVLPITGGTFMVGWLAISGIPPFSGFWSKDEILAGLWNENRLAWGLLLATAMLTAFYMTRLAVKVFFGVRNWPQDTKPHESAKPILFVLVVLAGLAMAGGVLNLPFASDLKFLEHWLEPSLFGNEAHLGFGGTTKWVLGIVSALGAVAGVMAAREIYTKGRFAGMGSEKIERKWMLRAWYYDDTVTAVAGGPGRKGFEALARFDRKVVDGTVMGTAKSVELMGWMTKLLQTGKVRSYALGITLGAVALLAYFVIKAGLGK